MRLSFKHYIHVLAVRSYKLHLHDHRFVSDLVKNRDNIIYFCIAHLNGWIVF